MHTAGTVEVAVVAMVATMAVVAEVDSVVALEVEMSDHHSRHSPYQKHTRCRSYEPRRRRTASPPRARTY